MTADKSETRPQLRKAIGGLGFFCLAFGSMIGVGWITTLGKWFMPAGPGGAMAAFAAGGLLMLLIGLCYAELTPMLPVSGGEVAYAYKAFGTGKAFLVGWFLTFGYLSVSAFEAVSIGMVLSYLFPGLDKIPLYEIHGSKVFLPHLVLAVAFTSLITWINFRGVAIAMRVQIVLTGLLIACTMLFVGASITRGKINQLAPLLKGQPVVHQLAVTAGVDEGQLLYTAAALGKEYHSLVPYTVANDAESYAKDRGLDIKEIEAATTFRAFGDDGATGIVNGRPSWVGKPDWAAQRADYPAQLHESLELMEQEGLEVLVVGSGKTAWGAIGLRAASIWKGILVVFVMAPFWFVGFDTIPQAAEERAPGQRVGRLGLYIVLAIVGSTLFYLLIMLAAGMAAPWQNTVTHKLPTAAAFEAGLKSPVLVKIVLSAGVIGLLTSWNGFFIAGTRVLFSLGRGHIIDARFGQTHPRYGTPTKAILFSGLITALVACLGRGALIAFVDVGSFCIAVAFLGVTLSLLKLRKTAPDAERPYRLPLAGLVAGLAAAGSLFILVAMIVPGSPVALVWPLEWGILLTFCVCGIIFWMRGTRQRRQTGERQRARLILDEE